MGYEREMSARQKALDLSKKKEAIEAEMDALFESLTAEGQPGLTGNLVDAEGFPRADIDIAQIRGQRNRLAILKTDHRNISEKLEQQMHIALAPREDTPTATGAAASSQPSLPARPPQPAQPVATHRPQAEVPNIGGPVSNGTPPPRRVPFALVDLVTPESPAASAGLLVDDKIVAFGGVSLRSFATPRLALGALPELLQGHENMELEVIIERSEAESVQIMTMKLTPRRWQGQGLLGCHVVPMSVSQTDSRYQPEVATAALARSMSSHV